LDYWDSLFPAFKKSAVDRSNPLLPNLPALRATTFKAADKNRSSPKACGSSSPLRVSAAGGLAMQAILTELFVA